MSWVLESCWVRANAGNWKVSILSILEVFHPFPWFSACHQFFPPDLPYFFPLIPWPSPNPTSFIRFHQRMVYHGGGSGTSHSRNLQLLGLGTFNRHCQRPVERGNVQLTVADRKGRNRGMGCGSCLDAVGRCVDLFKQMLKSIHMQCQMTSLFFRCVDASSRRKWPPFPTHGILLEPSIHRQTKVSAACTLLKTLSTSM